MLRKIFPVVVQKRFAARDVNLANAATFEFVDGNKALLKRRLRVTIVGHGYRAMSTAEVVLACYRPVNFVDLAARIKFVTLIRFRRRKRIVGLDKHVRINHVGFAVGQLIGKNSHQ